MALLLDESFVTDFHFLVYRILLQILQETEEDEVEFDKTGSWKTVEKS